MSKINTFTELGTQMGTTLTAKPYLQAKQGWDALGDVNSRRLAQGLFYDAATEAYKGRKSNESND